VIIRCHGRQFLGETKIKDFDVTANIKSDAVVGTKEDEGMKSE